MNVSVPIIEIKAFLEDDEILDLKKKFSKIGRENYINYFDKNLFFSHINFTDKEDVLKYMCDQVSKYRNIPDGFYDSILEREELSTTDFGENVAIPHTNLLFTDKNFACIGLLDSPVFWGVRDVQCVILIAISQNTTRDFENFFHKISQFSMNKKKINDVLDKRNYNDFINVLNEV